MLKLVALDGTKQIFAQISLCRRTNQQRPTTHHRFFDERIRLRSLDTTGRLYTRHALQFGSVHSYVFREHDRKSLGVS